MKKMRKQFIKLLGIHGVSGQEKAVRNYLKDVLPNMLDTVNVDSYGNLLGEVKVGDGQGATVLLSAHMDTVKGVLANRKLQYSENGNVISSDKGALGADDRGGIAIILQVLRDLSETKFNGTVKVAFSREEEIGCIGSKKIDTEWYQDVDLAIVVDRRGSRDIVTGCWNAFCCNEVGNFLEGVSDSLEMNWKAIEGGISDACSFSEGGVNAVNLSAGYYNEHKATEYAVFSEMCDTVRLINETLNQINDVYTTFTEVPFYNNWVKEYGNYNYGKAYGKTSGTQYSNHSGYSQEELDWYYENYGVRYDDDFAQEYGTKAINDDSTSFDDDIYFEKADVYGSIAVCEASNSIVIIQDDNEIVMEKETFKAIFSKASKFFDVKQ